MLQPIGIFAVAAVLWPARRLHVGGVPGVRPERSQGRCGMKGTGADLHVVRLQDYTAVIRPIALKLQDQPLKRALGSQRRRMLARQALHHAPVAGMRILAQRWEVLTL